MYQLTNGQVLFQIPFLTCVVFHLLLIKSCDGVPLYLYFRDRRIGAQCHRY